MPIRIEFKAAAPEAFGELAAQVIREESLRAADTAAIVAREAMVEVSVGTRAVGELAASWMVQPARAGAEMVAAGVSTTAVQALVLEEGAAAHHPPTAGVPALAVWIRRKLGSGAYYRRRKGGPKIAARLDRITDVRRVAEGIGRGALGRRGLPAPGREKGIFGRAWETKVEPEVKRIMDAMTERVVRRLEAGG